MSPAGTNGGRVPEAPARPSASEPSLARKGFLDGTHRLIPPEETLAKVAPSMLSMGITRIANVTHLDTIGIPVVMVCRPNARSLSVSQGKGLTLAAAKVSGLMESVEHYHAEHITLPLKLGALDELRQTHQIADVGALPRLSIGAFHEGLRILWITGHDLLGGAPTWVPFEVVHTDYSLPLPTGSGSFVMSSSGLASGNHPLEAISHALCELVERDAGTLFHLATPERQRLARVDPSTVDDPSCREALGLFERAGVDAYLWETTTDLAIPAFRCTIADHEPNPSRPIGPMTGMGCHPSRAVALLRALTEAAQSRLTQITGSRDDVRHGLPGPHGEIEQARLFQKRMMATPPERSFQAAPTHETSTFEEDVGWELDRLRAAGVTQVVVVELTKREFDIPVVRAVVPGLEAQSEIPGYVPGARARRERGR